MRRTFSWLAAGAMLIAGTAQANLCNEVKDGTASAESGRDVDFYQQLFPDTAYHGNRKWNKIVIECNRKRDNKGKDIAEVTQDSGDNSGKRTLRSANLDPKVIRGHYQFFGTPFTQLKYVYVLSKSNGVWTMTIPYKASINDLVKDRVDFNMGSRHINADGSLGSSSYSSAHAGKLYDGNQVTAVTVNGKTTYTLKADAKPIAETLCSSATYFEGDEDKYEGKSGANAHKRDKENKHISLGKIQYVYKDSEYVREGCRVRSSQTVYWRDGSGVVQKYRADDWVLDNFVRQAEDYWSIPGVFELKLLLEGRNEASFPQSVRKLLQKDDHLTVYFATKFMPYGGNQMYKSNIIQFNNFSTMTTDATYWHEVGHAFGLDDEYGKEKEDHSYKDNACENDTFNGMDNSPSYVMCGDGDLRNKRTIYHYIATSRYITKQNECDADSDCKNSEYCDKGTLTLGKNQCVAKKADNDTCALAGGDHQCLSGHCKLSRCYTPNSVAMGDTCYNDDACKKGKCNSVDGTKGQCVCKDDSDCGSGKWCDAGLDFKTNACRNKLDKGESCGKFGSMGNDHKCKSGECSGLPKYICK